MLVALGKALFWDGAVGSDGQACASCHFHAGADPRIVNQLSPGLKVQPLADVTFGGIFPAGSAGHHARRVPDATGKWRAQHYPGRPRLPVPPARGHHRPQLGDALRHQRRHFLGRRPSTASCWASTRCSHQERQARSVQPGARPDDDLQGRRQRPAPRPQGRAPQHADHDQRGLSSSATSGTAAPTTCSTATTCSAAATSRTTQRADRPERQRPAHARELLLPDMSLASQAVGPPQQLVRDGLRQPHLRLSRQEDVGPAALQARRCTRRTASSDRGPGQPDDRA